MNAREAKKLFLTIIFVIISVSLHAQNPVQKGIVRTALRPDREIVYLSDVSIRQKGGHNTVLSGSDGAFEMVLPDTRVGGAFYLSSVRKTGYELADNATIGKAFTYSPEVPIEIVMLDSRAKQEDIIRITNNAYARAEKEYAKKVAALEQQLQDKTLSEESYRQQLQELQTGFEKYESLISDMAERYASTDYATIDSLNAAINIAIENADLERADSLISTVGSLDRLVRESQEAMANARERQKIGTEIVEQASRDITDIEDNNRRLGDLLYSKYSISLTRFETDSAAYYITLRAELDTTNVEWQNETGVFIHDYMADYDKAMMLYQRALNITKTEYGEKHPDVAISLNNIGLVYSDRGDYGKALEYHDEALKIWTELFGQTNPGVATSLSNIGLVYSARGDYGKALEYFDEALKIWTELFGQTHPGVAAPLSNIGSVYHCRGDYGKALEYFDEALKIQSAIFGQTHPDVATSLGHIGLVYLLRGDYDKALEHFDEALKIRTELFGQTHPDVANSLSNIGSVYYDRGDYGKALEHFDEALKIRTELFGQTHPDVATSLSLIGLVYYNRGDYGKALEHFDEALKIQTTLYGENARETMISTLIIYDCYTILLKTSQSYIQPYEDFISEIAFTVTVVSDDTPAADQGMSGEYSLLEFEDWTQDSFDCLYEKNTELTGKPKDILVMKDGNISEHHFEDTTGVNIGLKYVGKEEKAAISKAYDNWKRQHNHESGK